MWGEDRSTTRDKINLVLNLLLIFVNRFGGSSNSKDGAAEGMFFMSIDVERIPTHGLEVDLCQF